MFRRINKTTTRGGWSKVWLSAFATKFDQSKWRDGVRLVYVRGCACANDFSRKVCSTRAERQAAFHRVRCLQAVYASHVNARFTRHSLQLQSLPCQRVLSHAFQIYGSLPALAIPKFILARSNLTPFPSSIPERSFAGHLLEFHERRIPIVSYFRETRPDVSRNSPIFKGKSSAM